MGAATWRWGLRTIDGAGAQESVLSIAPALSCAGDGHRDLKINEYSIFKGVKSDRRDAGG